MKKALSVLLAIATLVAIVPMTPDYALAAPTPEQALADVYIYAVGQRETFLSYNGTVQSVAMHYYSNVSITGVHTEYPAYCITPQLPGPSERGTYRVNTKDYLSNPKIWGIVTSGYPYKTIGELGVNTREQAYYATKMALWTYLNNWDVNLWTANGGEQNVTLAALKQIYAAGTAISEIPTPMLTVTPNNPKAELDSINPSFASQTFTVTANMDIRGYEVFIKGAAPDGTRVTDLSNNPKTVFNAGEQFKVLIPANQIHNATGNFEVGVTGQLRTNAVIYGMSYDAATQDFAVMRDPFSFEDAVSNVFYSPLTTFLEIIKLAAGTNTPLAGAEFRVTDSEGGVVGTFTTDSSGRVYVPLTRVGAHQVEEITPPTGYLLDVNAHKDVVVTWERTTTVSFANEKKPGLELQKVDAITGVGLENAVLRVAWEGGARFIDVKTGPAGMAYLPELDPGMYTVTELTAPPGFLLDPTPQVVILEPGRTARVILKNTERPGLIIRKYDEATGILLAGAEFSVAKMGGSIVYEGITDESGTIRLEDLDDGWYTVTELAPAQGYLIATESKNVYLEAGRVVEIKFDNRMRPALRILKVDMITGERLPNAEFRVSKVEGSTVSEYITDVTGEILITDLDEAIYHAEEFMPPDGYIRYDEAKVILTEWGTVKTLKFDNIRKPTLIVTKTNALTFLPVPDATFRIERENAGGGVATLGTYRTDANGQIILPRVEPGWHIITETIPAPGFSLPSDPTTRKYLAPGENAYTNFSALGAGGDISGLNITVTSGADYALGYEVINYPLNSIVIRKASAVTGELLAGAAFELRRVTGDVSGSSGTIIGRYTTDHSGVVVITGLQPGGYIVTEVQSPPNFLISENSTQQVWLKPDGTSIVEATFANIPYGAILITKVDAQTNQPLANARFRVTDSSGAVVGNTNGVFVTNANGEILIPNVKPGSHVITEIEAPKYYAIDTTPQTINVGVDGKIYAVGFKNQPAGELVIRKLDHATREPLSGAEFTVARMNGERILNEFNGYTFTTGNEGLIHIPGLEGGYYIVTETKAASGYILDAEPKTVLIQSGRHTVLEVLNTQQTGLRLIKIDSVTKRGIYNVEFMVFDQNGWVAGTFYTDNNGVIDFAGKLPEGRYTIRETRAAPGFYRDDVSRTVEFRAGQVTEIRWENTPQMAQLQILKKSGDDNEINGLPAGTPLAGAVFEAYDYKSGNLVDRFVSGADGWAVSKPLPLGRYVVKEVQAPQWYKLSAQTLDIELEFATQIVKMEFPNYSANTGVSIRKTGPAEIMPGDAFRYDIRHVRNDSAVQLTDFYWRDTLPTDAVRLTRIVTGTYNQALRYKILATTNKGEARVIADNLSTTVNNVIDCRNAALGLARDEYITSFTLVFGTVKAGFCQVIAPQVFVTANSGLPNGYEFANMVDAGGKYGNEWVVGNSTWVSEAYSKPEPLPRTGY